MKKKLLIAMLALTLAFTGCGGSDNAETANKDQTVNTEVAVSTENVAEQSTETAPETEVATNTEMVETTEVVESTETMDETEVVEESTEVAEEEAFTITAMSATKYAKSRVNVRKGAGAEYDRLGTLSMNDEVVVTGQAENGWYRIEFNGEVGYVSNSYLVNERVVVAQNTPTTNNNTGSNGNTQPSPSTNNSGSNGGSTPTPAPEQTPTTGIEPVDPTPTPEPTPTPNPEPTPEPSPAPETETAPRMLTVYIDTYAYFLAEDGSGAWVESYVGAGSTVALEGTMVDPRCVCMASSDPNTWTEGDLFEAREGVRGVLRVYYNYKRSEY